MSVAADLGDYDAVTELTGRLKRADILKTELERLQEEWQSVFNPESVPAELLEPPPFDENASVIVPDRYELCSPTLQALRTLRGQGQNRDIAQKVIEQMQLPAEVIRQPHRTELESELGWARSTLKTCKMIVNSQHRMGVWELTEAGTHQKELTPAEWEALLRRCHYGE